MNTGIKTMFVIYFLVIAALIFTDVSILNQAADNAKRTLDRAIDGGIIYGTIEEDYIKGRIRLDEDKVRKGINDLFRKNLNLDSSLSSETYQRGKLIVTITYHNGAPSVEAEYVAAIKMVAGKLVGLETQDIDIKKRTPYLSDYK
ncbi:hypothetical protein EJP82_26815 [Paenibacillus anaericanus]|uniref:Uncharacterized protein n=1 Tax=Paenibacillus anaericanus TaxID=170367 RepID=A0A433XVU8_9BACL|nr:hypothetical protein [Paenibacillus anaericanus]RUT38687.1 hypothetical protein EJP82_26815 [Paenibacillus anaericanus]